jgi:alanine-synthesizing transaminase
MRVNIVHPGAGELHYEIRGIVELAEQLAKTGIDITWENIGDPVAKGEQIPLWIREIVASAVKHNNESYGYSPTKGMQAARAWIAADRSKQGTVLPAKDILFFQRPG